MFPNPKQTRGCLFSLAGVFLILFSNAAWAKHEERPPALTIRITEVERMNWGTLAIPPSGPQYVELSPLTQSVKGTGTVLFGMPRRGVYRLSGPDEHCGAITIDIDNVSAGSPGLKLDHFEGVYSSIHVRNFPSPTLPAPDRQGTLLYLGARATVDSAMTPKSLAPTFDIYVIVN